MPKIRLFLAVLVLAWGAMPGVSRAAEDVAALRAELDALKQDYANRVGALEARINQIEAAQAGQSAQSAPSRSRRRRRSRRSRAVGAGG